MWEYCSVLRFDKLTSIGKALNSLVGDGLFILSVCVCKLSVKKKKSCGGEIHRNVIDVDIKIFLSNIH